MNQQPPEWSKQFTAWVKRQPRWMVIGGGLVILLMGALLLTDMKPQAADSGTGNAGDPYFGTILLALGVFARLLLVVLAIYFSALAFRRWQMGGGKAPARQLALVETLHLSQRRAVYLVRAGEQLFLLGATDQSINSLGQVNPAGQPVSSQISFDQHLSIATQKTMDTPSGAE